MRSSFVRINWPEERASDLIVATKNPVRHGNDLATTGATRSGEEHRRTEKDEGGAAGRLEYQERDEHKEVDQDGDNAGLIESTSGELEASELNQSHRRGGTDEPDEDLPPRKQSDGWQSDDSKIEKHHANDAARGGAELSDRP